MNLVCAQPDWLKRNLRDQGGAMTVTRRTVIIN
jgi:hypothetical protein